MYDCVSLRASYMYDCVSLRASYMYVMCYVFLLGMYGCFLKKKYIIISWPIQKIGMLSQLKL